MKKHTYLLCHFVHVLLYVSLQRPTTCRKWNCPRRTNWRNAHSFFLFKLMWLTNNWRYKVTQAASVLVDCLNKGKCPKTIALTCSVFSLLPACSNPIKNEHRDVQIKNEHRDVPLSSHFLWCEESLIDWYICWRFTNGKHAAQHNRKRLTQRQSLKDKGRSWWCAVGSWPWRGCHHSRSPKKEEKEGV